MNAIVKIMSRRHSDHDLWKVESSSSILYFLIWCSNFSGNPAQQAWSARWPEKVHRRVNLQVIFEFPMTVFEFPVTVFGSKFQFLFCRTLRSSCRQTIRRPGVGARKNDRFETRYTISTMKHAPSVMVLPVTAFELPATVSVGLSRFN